MLKCENIGMLNKTTFKNHLFVRYGMCTNISGRRITLRPHYVHPSEPAHNFLRSVFADGF